MLRRLGHRVEAAIRCLRGGEHGQAAVEYGGTLVLVAAIIGALSSIGLAATVRADIERAVCEITGGSFGGSCPAAGTATPIAAPGAQSTPLNPSPADVRQAEEQALGSTRLIDACAGGPSASALAAYRAPNSAACKRALAQLGPHNQAILAVIAAALQASKPGNKGNFALLLQAYLRDPAYAVIGLSRQAQLDQAAGNDFLARLQANGGNLWDGLLGSLCGGYGVCLGGDVLSESYQQAYHASAGLAKITAPVVLATGIAGVLKDLAVPGLRAVLLRLGVSSNDAQEAEQAVTELEGGSQLSPTATNGTVEQSSGAAGSGRGGIAPVLKGQAGVQRAIGELRAQGYSIEGQEVTIQTPVGRTRVDIVARDPSGNLIFEVKNGPTAKVNPNQERVFEYIRQHGGTPVGGNAAVAGFTPGETIGATPVRVIQYGR